MRSGGSDSGGDEPRAVPEPPVFEWAIEEILGCHPDLYLEHCAVMAVAVMARRSKSPCEFTVRCQGFSPLGMGADPEFRVRVSWNDQTVAAAQRLLRTEQRKPIVERAAVALAALLLGKAFPGSP